jgi:hypothetical protein
VGNVGRERGEGEGVRGDVETVEEIAREVEGGGRNGEGDGYGMGFGV